MHINRMKHIGRLLWFHAYPIVALAVPFSCVQRIENFHFVTKGDFEPDFLFECEIVLWFALLQVFKNLGLFLNCKKYNVLDPGD